MPLLHCDCNQLTWEIIRQEEVAEVYTRVISALLTDFKDNPVVSTCNYHTIIDWGVRGLTLFTDLARSTNYSNYHVYTPLTSTTDSKGDDLEMSQASRDGSSSDQGIDTEYDDPNTSIRSQRGNIEPPPEDMTHYRLLAHYSILVLASMAGCLVRLGLTAMGTYAGASIFPIAWSQGVGCAIMGLALARKKELTFWPPIFTFWTTGIAASVTTFSTWMEEGYLAFADFNGYRRSGFYDVSHSHWNEGLMVGCRRDRVYIRNIRYRPRMPLLRGIRRIHSPSPSTSCIALRCYSEYKGIYTPSETIPAPPPRYPRHHIRNSMLPNSSHPIFLHTYHLASSSNLSNPPLTPRNYAEIRIIPIERTLQIPIRDFLGKYDCNNRISWGIC